jgi:lipoprotein signal peptidase
MSVEVLERPVAGRTRRQTWAVLAILIGIGYCDQVTKAWAWRDADRVHVNSGGNMLVNPVVSGWLRNPVLGAGFDVVDTVVLAAALLLLGRRRRPPAVLAALTLVLAGWSSNVCDRLGLHYWTAPGSRRGVIDFLPFWGRLWNVADLAILAGSGLLLPALMQAGLRRRARAAGDDAAPAHNPLATRLGRRIVLGGLAVTALLATVGAFAGAGTDGPGLLGVHP